MENKKQLNGPGNYRELQETGPRAEHLTLSMRRVTESAWVLDLPRGLDPEVAVFGADQKERGLWERECYYTCITR